MRHKLDIHPVPEEVLYINELSLAENVPYETKQDMEKAVTGKKAAEGGNLKAYKALIKSFKKSNRACIVHPTGLGKSYIVYQLIADNPDSAFLVLLV